MATPNANTPSSIYHIRITLEHVEPSVWRRVQVEDCSLETLHGIIQDAMGWENYHLYAFQIDDVEYTNPMAVDEDNRSAAEMTLGQVAERKCKEFDYVYDFGDEWHHRIVIEGVHPAEADVHYPRCVEGSRRCPPEDCGGPWGYENILAAIDDPEHEQHEDILDWIGEKFDPAAFDVERVNRIWASWDFSDPNSGPIYDDEPAEPEPEKPKSKAKEKIEEKPSNQSHVARNDPCPCGSGKKYKKCCLKRGKEDDYDE